MRFTSIATSRIWLRTGQARQQKTPRLRPTTSSMARLCQVCDQLESKYKCPTCHAAYCSASCYKKHKEAPCTTPGTSDEIARATPATSNPADLADIQPSVENEGDEDIDPTKLLTVDQVSKLRESALARENLGNSHIRDLLAQIDSSSNRMKALEKALLDPAFSSFMFRALDEVRGQSFI